MWNQTVTCTCFLTCTRWGLLESQSERALWLLCSVCVCACDWGQCWLSDYVGNAAVLRAPAGLTVHFTGYSVNSTPLISANQHLHATQMNPSFVAHITLYKNYNTNYGVQRFTEFTAWFDMTQWCNGMLCFQYSTKVEMPEKWPCFLFFILFSVVF